MKDIFIVIFQFNIIKESKKKNKKIAYKNLGKQIQKVPIFVIF
jgi:uncharacterized protein (UPF0212 family)